MSVGFDETDFKACWRVIVLRKRMVLGMAFAGLVLAFAVNLFSSPVYRASTRIEIRRQLSRSPISGEVLENPTAQAENLALFTTEQLITNRPLLQRLSGSLCGAGPVGPVPGGPLRPLFARLGLATPRSATPARAADDRVEWLLQAISVRPVRDTRLVDVQVEHWRPDCAREIAAKLVDQFVAYEMEQQAEAASGENTFLRRQLTDLHAELDSTQRLLDERTAGGDAPSDLDVHQRAATIGELNATLIRTQTERLAASARYDAMRAAKVDSTWSGGALPLRNPRLEELQSSLAQKRSELATASQVMGPQHPRRIALETELRGIRQDLAAAWADALQDAKTEADLLANRERDLRRALADEQSALGRADEQQQRVGLLEGEIASKRQLYDALVKKVEESRVSGALGEAPVRIVEPASVSLRPVKPRKALNLAVGLAVGVFAGTGIALALEYFRRTIRTPGDVTRELELPVLGMIPRQP